MKISGISTLVPGFLVLVCFTVNGYGQELTKEQKDKKCFEIDFECIEKKVNLASLEEKISQAWPDRQIERARTDMSFIRNVHKRCAKGFKSTESERKQFMLIAHEYNFKDNDLGCDEISFFDLPCTANLEKFIANKIDIAVSLKGEKSGFPEQKKKLEKQILELQSKMTELGCEFDLGGCHSPFVTGKFIINGDPTGILVLTQSKRHVTGFYGADEKSLKNTLSGDFDECNTLTGIFTNNQYKVTGTFTYTFSAEGSSYTGKWKNDKDGKTGKTSGQRQKTLVNQSQ